MFKFQTFNVLKVLAHTQPLLGSKGLEYELDAATMALDPKARLKKQRQLLKSQLAHGEDSDILEKGAPSGFEGLLDDEDVMASRVDKRKRDEADAEASAPAEPSIDLTGMSARERNQAKRLAKQNAMKKGREANMVATPSSSAASAARSTTMTDQTDPGKMVVESHLDADQLFATAEEWPFQGRCEELCNDLFHPKWEYRHGAAVGLRAIIKLHGNGAGKAADAAPKKIHALHDGWMEDMAIRLICVCALDHFGDFVTDEVVAPVRNTAAEALSVVLKYMRQEAVGHVLTNLLELQRHSNWQVRHGGLLGIKYLVAVRSDLIEFLLPTLLPVITGGLKDTADDVRAAAAQAFLPIAQQLITLQPSVMGDVITILWNALLELDDLTASTNSVLQLLSTLLAAALHQNGGSSSTLGPRPLVELIPRLWPFLRHAQATVRRAVLQTLKTVITINQDWVEPIVLPTLRYLFQNLLVESVAEVRLLSSFLWRKLVQGRSVATVTQCAQSHLGIWLGQVVTPAGVELDSAHFLAAKTHTGMTAAVAAGSAGGSQEQPRKRQKKVKKGWEEPENGQKKPPPKPNRPVHGEEKG